VGLLGELGSTWSQVGQPLLPIGTVYDPFVGRALEPWSFGTYAGGQSILVGTPSGVTLAPEGGAHQSIGTPSIGLEQPGVTAYEPAFAVETEWCLLEAMSRLGRPDGESAYLRLTTRPLDQALCRLPEDEQGRAARRRDVLAMNLTYAEQRALEIGITIAGGAEVILLDEPTAGMSLSETTRFIQLIREITVGKTLLTVEHDMGVVFGLADKIAVLVYGEVIAFDVPDAVRANAKVQEAYLGSVLAEGGH